MTDGITQIANERTRQKEKYAWSAEHDDEHDDYQLAWAAVCYAAPRTIVEAYQSRYGIPLTRDPWPWNDEWDKRPRNSIGLVLENQGLPVKRYIRNLAKAGALIAAEIDRLTRTLDSL